MKRILSILVIITTMMITAHAGPYPVVSSLTTTIVSPTSAFYQFDWTVIDIPAADQPAPNKWSFVRAHRHDAFPGGEDTVAFGGNPERPGDCNSAGVCYGIVQPGETMSQAAMRITDNGRGLKSGQMNHLGKGNGNECVGYIFLPPGVSTVGTKWSRAVYPGPTCVYAPPGKDFCEITTPSITIDHGVLTVTDANGDTASELVTMRCTTATKVTLRLLSGVDYIPMQDNAKAKIRIDGKSAGGTFDFPAGNTQVLLESTLMDIKKEGDYSGYSVLIIEPA